MPLQERLDTQVLRSVARLESEEFGVIMTDSILYSFVLREEYFPNLQPSQCLTLAFSFIHHQTYMIALLTTIIQLPRASQPNSAGSLHIAVPRLCTKPNKLAKAVSVPANEER